MEKNEILRLTAVDYTEQGLAVCKVDGFVVFVKDMLVGEEADVQLLKVNKKLAYGRVKEFITKSKDRVVPTCPIAYSCGGCQVQHMSYEHQLCFKHNHVKHLFDRSFEQKFDILPVIGMENPWMYRNKSQVPFETKKGLTYGFYRSHSHDILPFETCFIQNDDSNKILAFIKDFYVEHEVTPEDLRHVLIKKGIVSEEIMVVFIHKNKHLPLQDKIVEALKETFPNIKAILLNVNPADDNVILGKKTIQLTKESKITDQLGDFTFQISANSFYQVNPVQAKKLYETAIDFANIQSHEIVLDLYCGIGTIALFASEKAKKVYGAEINPQAIDDARINAEINNISNIEFVVADAAIATKMLVENNVKMDVIVVDPPRKGLDQDTIDAIKTLEPSRLVYVSCDPSTLVRDCVLLQDKYNIERIQPVDMFPQTFHVETVVLMSRIND